MKLWPCGWITGNCEIQVCTECTALITEMTLILTSPSVHTFLKITGNPQNVLSVKYKSWEQCGIQVKCMFSIILTKEIACWSVSIFSVAAFGRLRWQTAHLGDGWARGCCWEAKLTVSVNAIIKKTLSDEHVLVPKHDEICTKTETVAVCIAH